jgi:hypothetical protein
MHTDQQAALALSQASALMAAHTPRLSFHYPWLKHYSRG